MMVALTGIVMAVQMCPWESDPQTFVPALPISVGSTYAGTCTGVMTISEQTQSQFVENGTKIVGNNLDYLGSVGNHDVALQTVISNRPIGVSIDAVQDIKYSGVGAILGTNQFGMEVTNGQGNDTQVNCNIAISGADLILTDGEYAASHSTSVLGNLYQGYAVAAKGDGMVNLWSASSSRTGLQYCSQVDNETVCTNKLYGMTSTRFNAMSIGKFDTQYAYNYQAGLTT